MDELRLAIATALFSDEKIQYKGMDCRVHSILKEAVGLYLPYDDIPIYVGYDYLSLSVAHKTKIDESKQFIKIIRDDQDKISQIDCRLFMTVTFRDGSRNQVSPDLKTFGLSISSSEEAEQEHDMDAWIFFNINDDRLTLDRTMENFGWTVVQNREFYVKEIDESYLKYQKDETNVIIKRKTILPPIKKLI